MSEELVNKVKVYNRFDRPKISPLDCTRFLEPEYAKCIGDDGLETVVKTGDYNIIDFIQESRDSCDVYKLLERYERGDINALNKVAGVYADITDMPHSLADAFAIVQRSDQLFEKLPEEIRKEFNYSKKIFYDNLNTDKISSVFEAYFKSKNAVLKTDPDIPDKKVVE